MLLCLGTSHYQAQAEVVAQNTLLSNLMEQLAEHQVSTDFTGEKYLSLIGQSKPLIVQRNAQHVIEHIGVKLFDRNLMQKYPSPLYRFIERYFLELLLEKDDAAIADRLHLERIQLTSDVPASGNYKKWLQAIIAECSPEHSILITCNNNRYHVCETHNQRTVFSLYLPVRYELITGFTKPEAERAVYNAVILHPYAPVRQYADDDYFASADGLYLLNDEYYGTEDIISTSYYKKEGAQFVPVFGATDAVKSVYNLFNVPWDVDLTAEVTQNLYGNKTLTYEVSVGRFTNYLRSMGCSLYTGIQKIEGDQVRGVVMAVNSSLGYQHYISFTISGPVWESPSKGQIKLKMYSYIPSHNVSVLFDDYK
jgi:hypothetical protein